MLDTLGPSLLFPDRFPEPAAAALSRILVQETGGGIADSFTARLAAFPVPQLPGAVGLPTVQLQVSAQSQGQPPTTVQLPVQPPTVEKRPVQLPTAERPPGQPPRAVQPPVLPLVTAQHPEKTPVAEVPPAPPPVAERLLVLPPTPELLPGQSPAAAPTLAQPFGAVRCALLPPAAEQPFFWPPAASQPPLQLPAAERAPVQPPAAEQNPARSPTTVHPPVQLLALRFPGLPAAAELPPVLPHPAEHPPVLLPAPEQAPVQLPSSERPLVQPPEPEHAPMRLPTPERPRVQLPAAEHPPVRPPKAARLSGQLFAPAQCPIQPPASERLQVLAPVAERPLFQLLATEQPLWQPPAAVQPLVHPPAVEQIPVRPQTAVQPPVQLLTLQFPGQPATAARPPVLAVDVSRQADAVGGLTGRGCGLKRGSDAVVGGASGIIAAGAEPGRTGVVPRSPAMRTSQGAYRGRNAPQLLDISDRTRLVVLANGEDGLVVCVKLVAISPYARLNSEDWGCAWEATASGLPPNRVIGSGTCAVSSRPSNSVLLALTSGAIEALLGVRRALRTYGVQLSKVAVDLRLRHVYQRTRRGGRAPALLGAAWAAVYSSLSTVSGGFAGLGLSFLVQPPVDQRTNCEVPSRLRTAAATAANAFAADRAAGRAGRAVAVVLAPGAVQVLQMAGLPFRDLPGDADLGGLAATETGTYAADLRLILRERPPFLWSESMAQLFRL